MNKTITTILSFAMFVMLAGGGFFFVARWNADMTFLRNELTDVRQQMGSLGGRVDSLNAQVNTLPTSIPGPAQAAITPVTVNHVPQAPDLSTLKRDMAAVQMQLTQLNSNQETPLPEAEPLGIEDRQTQDAEAERKDKQRFQELGNYFAAQEVDNEWSNISTDSLQQGIDQFVLNRPDGGTTLHNLECKQTLCVMDVEHNNLQDKMQFEMDIMLRYPEHFSGTNSRQESGADGRIRTVTYLAKKGEKFPTLTAQ